MKKFRMNRKRTISPSARHIITQKPRKSPIRTTILFLLLSITTRLFSPQNTTNHWKILIPIHFANADTVIDSNDGPTNLAEGKRLLDLQQYEKAAPYFWRAVLFHGTQSPSGGYSVSDAFEPFLSCYAMRGKTIDAFLFVVRESLSRGQMGMARVYIDEALRMDPENGEALELKEVIEGNVDGYDDNPPKDGGAASTVLSDAEEQEEMLRLYNRGNDHFAAKEYELAAESFDRACVHADRYPALRVACTNAIYCRTNIMDWGYRGAKFRRDMDTVTRITLQEVAEWRSATTDNDTDTDNDNDNDHEKTEVRWKRATSVHPHMMLGYPIDTKLKKYVAESYATMDEPSARFDSSTGTMKDLPPDLPYSNDHARRTAFVLDAVDPSFKIRIAFVSSGFNSKAVLYLSHDMFRCFNRDRFEVHVFSMGDPDHPDFIRHAMRGVDWRERVRVNVDRFHDVRHLKDDHVALARLVHDEKIHVLVEWDGYARQGLRAQGLFALRPAPILVLHQEYLGTTGGEYFDYIVTDRVTSPPRVEGDYTEKFMYMPNHFFSKGHAVQHEVNDPTDEYLPYNIPYQLGTGSPQDNRCGAPTDIGPKQVSFVYCNFNKFLKNNPQTVESWIAILRRVPNSILCLLENPKEGVNNLRRFVRQTATADAQQRQLNNNNNNDDYDYDDDGPDLVNRIHFLKWEANPFDHQTRNHDYCNVNLDSYPYNGHTTAQDSLYAGVPIVTRSDGDDMASRVTTSANVVLGLDHELNAYHGPRQYEDMAVALGLDEGFFRTVREKLMGTIRMKSPMHPYWDVQRYVRDLEALFGMAWERYLSGKENRHLSVDGVLDDDGRRSEL